MSFLEIMEPLIHWIVFTKLILGTRVEIDWCCVLGYGGWGGSPSHLGWNTNQGSQEPRSYVKGAWVPGLRKLWGVTSKTERKEFRGVEEQVEITRGQSFYFLTLDFYCRNALQVERNFCWFLGECNLVCNELCLFFQTLLLAHFVVTLVDFFSHPFDGQC